ncbi:hypothetical protein CPC08DRAFT_166977, partial [Agrocybe pediades]
LTIYADRALKEECEAFGYASNGATLDTIDDFKALMNELIASAEALSIDSVMKSDIATLADFASVKEFVDKLSVEIEKIGDWLMETFEVPDTDESQEERQQRRADTVDKALDKVEDAFVKTYAVWNVPEGEGREKFGKVKGHIRSAVLAVGDLAEKHPLLVDAILFTASVLIIPEWLLLRVPLRLLGFGPLGPAKGSVAAWAQRYFFGAAVKEGSWFSRLQRAGMKWWGK